MESKEEIIHQLNLANGYGTEGAPREWTDQEVCERFVKAALDIGSNWAEVEDRTPEERCRGVVFSLLAMLDGANISIPAFDLVPAPHPNDKAYHIENKCNYYVARPVNQNTTLHDLMVEIEKRATK